MSGSSTLSGYIFEVLIYKKANYEYVMMRIVISRHIKNYDYVMAVILSNCQHFWT